MNSYSKPQGSSRPSQVRQRIRVLIELGCNEKQILKRVNTEFGAGLTVSTKRDGYVIRWRDKRYYRYASVNFDGSRPKKQQQPQVESHQ